jgi:hypothetical protein
MEQSCWGVAANCDGAAESELDRYQGARFGFKGLNQGDYRISSTSHVVAKEGGVALSLLVNDQCLNRLPLYFRIGVAKHI